MQNRKCSAKNRSLENICIALDEKPLGPLELPNTPAIPRKYGTQGGARLPPSTVLGGLHSSETHATSWNLYGGWRGPA